MTAVLETKSVNKTYELGATVIRAVQDVTVSVQAGEFVALVGPSGSGKTTLLAMLAGLLSPSGGGILIDGSNLGKMGDAERTRFRREKIGFTFQANNLVPFLTAQENVELMLRLNSKLNREGKLRAIELLTRLGLGDRLKNLPRQLSGGQQQRVAIARALIHNPSVVLADEPTASLDTERAFQVVETFSSLIHEQQRAGIMVTHDLRMCQYADRIVQMMDGQVVRMVSDQAEIQNIARTSKIEGPTLQSAVASPNGKRPAPASVPSPR